LIFADHDPKTTGPPSGGLVMPGKSGRVSDGLGAVQGIAAKMMRVAQLTGI